MAKSNKKIATAPTNSMHPKQERGVQQTANGNRNAQQSGDGSILNVININDQLIDNAEAASVQQINEEQEIRVDWDARDRELLTKYFKLCKDIDPYFMPHARQDEDAIRRYFIGGGLAHTSKDGHIYLTAAGIVFCCRRDLIPREKFHTDVKLIQRSEDEDLNQKTFGSVLHLYYWLIKRLDPLIQNKITSPDHRDKVGRELVFSDYPRVAIVEALVNFLIHRDYSQRDQGWTTVFSDRIEFMNPGQSEIPPDQLLIADKVLRPINGRNHLLIEAMSMAGLNQREGSGIVRIKKELRENQTYRSDGTLGLQIENDKTHNRCVVTIYKRMPRASRDIRIQGENNSVNVSILMARPGSAPPLPSLVIGREDVIKDLKYRLGIGIVGQPSGRLYVLTAIKGWPGVGKTTVASALAHDRDIATVFPDGVLWVSLGQNPSLLAGLATWGRALGTEEILKAKSIEEAQNLLAGLLRNKRMLLIIDDVWKAEDAIPFKVGGPDCATLITTRLDSIANALAPVADNIYRLKVLKDDDAIELLKQLAPTVVKQYPSECLALVQELEGLPLALQVAGRLLHTEASYGFSVSQLIDELREGAKLLESVAPADRTDLVTETTPTIAALLQRSLDHLDDKTKECYAYLGVFAPKPATFDMEAMKYIWQMDDPNPVVKTLVDRGLLEYMPELDRYQMHALLVLHARSLLIAG